jgi:hypothetical protein
MGRISKMKVVDKNGDVIEIKGNIVDGKKPTYYRIEYDTWGEDGWGRDYKSHEVPATIYTSKERAWREVTAIKHRDKEAKNIEIVPVWMDGE